MSPVDALRRKLLEWVGLAGVEAPVAASQGAERTLRLPFAPVPSNAAALAATAVDAIRGVDGIALDYSPDSLAHIDRIVLGFRAEGLGFDQIGETLFTFGCYVGEVIVRSLGARWDLPNADEQRAGLSLMGVRLVSGAFLNPIGKAVKLLRNGHEDSVAYFFQALAVPGGSGRVDAHPGTK